MHDQRKEMANYSLITNEAQMNMHHILHFVNILIFTFNFLVPCVGVKLESSFESNCVTDQ